MGLGPLFNMKAWDNVARQAMIRCSLATQQNMLSYTGSVHLCIGLTYWLNSSQRGLSDCHAT